MEYYVPLNIRIMKKINVLLAGFAVMSLVSCNGLLGDLGVRAPGVDLKVDRQSEVSSVRLVDLDGNSHVKTATDGELFIEKQAKEPVKSTCTLGSGQTAIPGKLTIDGSDLPDAAKPHDGSLLTSAVIITVDNPASETVDFGSTVTVDDKTESVGGLTVPENSVKSFGLIKGDKDEVKERSHYDDPVLLSEGLGGAISDGIDEILITGLSVTPEKGTVTPSAANTYEFQVKAKYYASLSYSPGSKIHVDKTFNDLDILIDIDEVFKEYDIYFKVESTIPFDIKFSASSPDGLVGTSDDIIKAGNPGKPVSSNVVLHVIDNSGKKVDAISTATLSLDLTAVEGAKFTTGQTLKIDTDKLTIVKVQ